MRSLLIFRSQYVKVYRFKDDCDCVAADDKLFHQKMGKQKKTRKFAVAKKIITAKDPRIKENQMREAKKTELENKKKLEAERHINQVPSALFFQYNTQLGPPYQVS